MLKLQISVPAHVPAVRLKNYLSRVLPMLDVRERQRIVKQRDVKLETGERLDADALIPPGSLLTIYVSHLPPVPVVYENPDLVVCDKPPGVSTDQDAYGSVTLQQWAQLCGYCLLPVHRLDNATRGLVAFARSIPAQEALQRMFAERLGEKEYRCLVKGAFPAGNTVLTDYLVKKPGFSLVRVQKHPSEAAKKIVTEVENLQSSGHTSRLKVLLHTGRTHQIRAHLAFYGHPVVGDDLYGDRALNRSLGNPALKLCAVRLLFNTNGQLPSADGLTVAIPDPFL